MNYKFFHKRVLENCFELFEQGHFKHAAHEAMKQVEIALKEKSFPPENLYGVRLIKWVFGTNDKSRLLVPLNEDLQQHAEILFEGAFKYYRNYTAHDGAEIDEISCFRVLVLASELLDLIGASRRSFEGYGGIAGLVETRLVKDKDEFSTLLMFLDQQTIIEDDWSDFESNYFSRGFNADQVEAIFDLGLVIYNEELIEHDLGEFINVGEIKLTDFGNKILSEL